MMTPLYCLADEPKTSNTQFADFDPGFLNTKNAGPQIDLSSFRYGNPIYPGEYRVDVYVNNQWQGKSTLIYQADKTKTGLSVLCLTDELINRLGLNLASVNLPDTSNITCTHASESLPADITLSFNLTNLSLNASIPQIYLIKHPQGYIDPDMWDSGVKTAFINYRVNHYQYDRDQGNNSHYSYLNLKGGLNLGGWSYRHNGYFTHSNTSSDYGGDNGDKDKSSYTTTENYIQHDISALRSQFKIGDAYSSGVLFDSIGLRGIHVQSDDRMLPSSLRQYAPLIQGYANSNAMVQILQAGNEIYNTTVPAGNFIIQDLYPPGRSGDLTVVITEANGSSRSFTVPYASVSELIRPGIAKYEMSLGKVSYSNQLLNEKGILGTWQYGLTNLMTVNTGAIIADSYYAGIIGGAMNTSIGAVSFDMTHAKSKFDDYKDKTGQSYEASYNRDFTSLGTNFRASYTRYSKDGFYDWQDVAIVNDYKDQSTAYALARQEAKDRMQLSINQRLPDNLGTFYGNINRKQYWNQSRNDNSWAIGYGNNWGPISYSVTYSNSRYLETDKWQKELTFYISIPLGERHYATAQMNKMIDQNTNYSVGLNGTVGDNRQYTYGVTASHNDMDTQDYNSWSANATAKTSYTKLSASYSDMDSSSQWSAGASGGVVLHPGGVLLSNEMGDTFGIIHADGAAGALVTQGTNIKLNDTGYAIIPNMMPYNRNVVGIDPKNIPVDVEVKETRKEVVPTANSTVLISLSTKVGNAALLAFRLPDGALLPAGASVFDLKGNSLGHITQGSRLFTNDLQSTGTLIVKYHHGQQCQAVYDLAKVDQLLNNQIKLLKLTCQPN